jgi:hypothetical protein
MSHKQRGSREGFGFEQLLARLIPEEELERLGALRRDPRGRPAEVPTGRILKGMIFHALQSGGTLGQNFALATGEHFGESGLSQRRTRMPWEMFRGLLDVALRARATKSKQPNAFYKGLRLVGIDGTKFSLQNLPVILKDCSKSVSRRLRAAFAKVTTCVMLEIGMHNPIAAEVARERESEWQLAMRVIERLPKKSLLLVDRYYGVSAFLTMLMPICEKDGSHFLVRARKQIKRKIRCVKKLFDGSRLIDLPVAHPTIQHRFTHYLRVREIRATIKRKGQKATRVRFFTSLLDPQDYPAIELVELYAKRWGQEVYYRLLKRELRRSELLQSHTVETACQEIAALLIATALIAEQRKNVALANREFEVTDISFARTLAHTRALAIAFAVNPAAFPPRVQRQYAENMFRVLLPQTIPKKRVRSYPRAVRQPVRGWPRKLKNSCNTNQIEITMIKNWQNS